MLTYANRSFYALPGWRGIGTSAAWVSVAALEPAAPSTFGHLWPRHRGIGRLGRLAAVTPGASSLIQTAAVKYGIDPALLLAVAKQESGLNQSVTSPAGAIGVMQLMPATAAGLGVNPSDLTQNVEGGARLLSQLITQYNGNLSLALAAYNAGPGAVAKYGGVPPYPETQNYVSNILANYTPSADWPSTTYGPNPGTQTVTPLPVNYSVLPDYAAAAARDDITTAAPADASGFSLDSIFQDSGGSGAGIDPTYLAIGAIALGAVLLAVSR